MDWIELPHEPHHIGVPSGASKMISKPMVRSAHPCAYLALRLALLQTDWIKLPLEPRHLGVPSGVSKTISEPMVHLDQTMHLSCVKISTLSKWTETSFHLSIVTSEYHWVRPKWFLSLWHVLRNPCIYVAPTLTLYPNRPKWDSIWPTSPRSFIGSVQNYF
jgi:hypothetical protein